jgi:hypothetical protein
MDASNLIAVSAIVIGFSVTAIMFRVQRELFVFETLKIKLLWLAWADYLILASVALAVLGATIPLLVSPKPSSALIAVAAASCIAALVLQAGYIPAILAHYRIEMGSTREGPRAKGEPAERVFVIGAFAVAAVTFGIALFLRT